MMDVTLTQLENSTEIFAEADTGNKQWVAIITDTHPKYNYEREFVAYQKPKTSNRDSGRAEIEEGDVVEKVRYTHSGKNDTRRYYQLVAGELHEIDETEITQALEGIIVEVEDDDDDDETHECEECGKEFDSEHGVSVHMGMVHADDEESSEPSPEADNDSQEVVADGGVDVSEYDIDPTELEYELKNTTRDNTNSRTNHLGRVEDTDIWVAYRTWQTGPSEYDYAIKGIGRLSMSGVDLDTDLIAETIRENASTDIREPEERDETDERLVELVENADAVAEQLVDEWQFGAEEVVGNGIYEGVAGVNGTRAWMSHVEEAYHYEVEYALDQCDIDQDEHGRVMDHTRSGLYTAAAKLRTRWLKPHLEYEVRLEFEVEPWKLRAIELEQNGVFDSMPKTARVWALKEQGLRNMEIAERLDISPSTVTRQISRAEEQLERAKWTVRNKRE